MKFYADIILSGENFNPFASTKDVFMANTTEDKQ